MEKWDTINQSTILSLGLKMFILLLDGFPVFLSVLEETSDNSLPTNSPLWEKVSNSGGE
jgi:hypothetical protein